MKHAGRSPFAPRPRRDTGLGAFGWTLVWLLAAAVLCLGVGVMKHAEMGSGTCDPVSQMCSP